jgi:biopolymer transport protein ExbD
MSMSVGEADNDGPMNEINTTPLVDVMLVLLIIFLIAIPVVIKTVKIKLPILAYQPTVSKAENMIITVRAGSDGRCQVYLNTTPTSSSKLFEIGKKRYEAETKRLGPADSKNPDMFPEVHVRGDQKTPWRCIGGVMYQMQSAGFVRVGFISNPNVIG